MMTIKSSTHNRLYGFDLIRILSMIAILVLHTNEAVFWTDKHPLPTDISVYRLVLAFAQIITYSGFTVIALSFLLLGRGRTLGLGKFILLLLFGLLTLAWFESDPPFSGFYWEWDIYAFLLCSSVAVFLLARVPFLHRWLIPVFFAILWIPFWNLIPNTTGLWNQA
ncbi:MAG: hypothetical protein KF789_11225, partial [Bdellovibrionaceae bacterium]|nr:hypothetical protein [Pseudobdellovibrionaceae bacterium]